MAHLTRKFRDRNAVPQRSATGKKVYPAEKMTPIETVKHYREYGTATAQEVKKYHTRKQRRRGKRNSNDQT